MSMGLLLGYKSCSRDKFGSYRSVALTEKSMFPYSLYVDLK